MKKILNKMKNLKLISTMLFALSVFFLVSCEFFSKENVNPQNNSGIIVKSAIQKLYESSFNGNSVVINGDTTVNYQEIKLHDKPTTTNINGLMNKDGSFKMVAIGGGITAGARDGGLHRNGQLTSFPNLIAIQMKANFKQPLFDIKEANGFGYKVVSSVTNGIPKYKSIGNNTALSKSSPIVELNPFVGENDNWGIPFSGKFGLRNDRNFSLVSYPDFSNPFKTRFWIKTPEQGKNNAEFEILNGKFDFVLLESGLDDYITAVLNGSTLSSSTYLKPPAYEAIMKFANLNKLKAAIATSPDVLDFPLLNTITIKDIRRINQVELYVKNSYNADYQIISIQNEAKILPNGLADSLINPKITTTQKRGFSYKNPLEFREIYTIDKIKSLQADLDFLNKDIIFNAKYYNYPVVDLYSVFKKISLGSYVTEDGINASKWQATFIS